MSLGPPKYKLGAPVASAKSAGLASIEDHIAAWKRAGRLAEDALWIRADVAASYRGKAGDKGLETFARAVDCGRSTVFQLARVAVAYPPESRRLDLTYSHHVAALRASEGSRAKLLAEAAEADISVRDLREKIAPAKTAVHEQAVDTAQSAGAQAKDAVHEAASAEVVDVLMEAKSSDAPPPPAAAAPALPEEPKPVPQTEAPRFLPSDPEEIAALVIREVGPLAAEDVAAEILRQTALTAA